MEAARNIRMVANALKNLFADKSNLSGFNDWDTLIGCVMMLEQTAGQLEAKNVDCEVQQSGEL